MFRDIKGDFAYCARTCHPLSMLRGADLGVGGCGSRVGWWRGTVGKQFVGGGPVRRSLHVKCIRQQTILIPSPPAVKRAQDV